MAGRTDLKYSTMINVVDLSLIEFENWFANREFVANLISNKSGEITQKGDSGYPLWRTDQECNHIYQVSSKSLLLWLFNTFFAHVRMYYLIILLNLTFFPRLVYIMDIIWMTDIRFSQM